MAKEPKDFKAMQDVISLAVSAAEQMRNHYRVYDGMVDALRKGASLIQGIKEIESHAMAEGNKARAEIGALNAEVNRLSDNVSSLREQSQVEERRLESWRTEEKEKIENEMAPLRAELSNARRAVALIEREKKEIADRLDAGIKAKQSELDTLKAGFEAFKRTHGLGV